MREKIADWGKRLEALVVVERGQTRFKDAVRPNEYVHVFGHDSSMLEIVLDRGISIYRSNQYTRIVWSEQNPHEAPFSYTSYEYNPDLAERPEADPEKPKQAWYDDQEWKKEFLTAAAVEKILFNPLSSIDAEAA